MPRTAEPTRERIIAAASKLFYAEGIGRVSVDTVAAKAGVTKRTLYYHFASKDDLVAAYLDARDQPNIARMSRWYVEAAGGPDAKVAAIFTHLAAATRHPRWKGCGFLRTAAELVATPGHPAVRIGARHKSNFEAWLATELAAAGIAAAPRLAREIVILMDGAFAVMLIHRDARYMEAAGGAARRLVASALPAAGRRRKAAPT